MSWALVAQEDLLGEEAQQDTWGPITAAWA